MHCAGTRGIDLYHYEWLDTKRPIGTQVARGLNLHPAAGLDVLWTRSGLRIVGPGPGGPALWMYGGGEPTLIARRSWAYPLLAYDSQRGFLHLAFSGWCEESGMYDVVYYLRSTDAGRSWMRADGSPFPLPFEYRWRGLEPDVLSRRQQSSGGEADTLVHSIVVDSAGRPHILYSFAMPYAIGVGPADGPDRQPWSRTKYVRWTGTEWQSTEIVSETRAEVAGGSLVVFKHALAAVIVYTSSAETGLDLGYIIINDGVLPSNPVAIARTNGESTFFAPAAAATSNRIHYVCPSVVLKQESRLHAGSFIPL